MILVGLEQSKEEKMEDKDTFYVAENYTRLPFSCELEFCNIVSSKKREFVLKKLGSSHARFGDPE